MNKVVKIIEAKYVRKDNSSINVTLEHKDLGEIEYCFLPNEKDESLDAEIRELLVDFEIEAYIEPEKTTEQIEAEFKLAKQSALDGLSVTTTAGHKFDANTEARLNLTNAIMASDITGISSTNWKLYDNTVIEADLTELKEALTLAIQKVGEVVMCTTLEELQGVINE